MASATEEAVVNGSAKSDSTTGGTEVVIMVGVGDKIEVQGIGTVVQVELTWFGNELVRVVGK